jgi:hypothetical protein
MVRGVSWELERPSVAPVLRVREASTPITGNHREVAGGHQGVGGGRSTAMTAGTTQPGRREGPLLHRCNVLEEGSVSAR